MRALVCQIGEKRFSIDLRQVREVVAAGPLTPVPTAPPEIRGVTQVRGQILPVVDLGAALRGSAASPVAAARLVDVEAAGVRLLLDVGVALDVTEAGDGGLGDATAIDLAALIEGCARRMRGAAPPLPRP
ncbi:MAG: chemotaxis protein CheW [Myxococcota bacterium]